MTNQEHSDLYDKVCQHLISNGWSRYASVASQADEVWYKQYMQDDIPRCRCNDNIPGIQVGISVYKHSYCGSPHIGYQIEVRGQKKDLAWVILQVYGWEGTLLEAMDSQIAQLLAAWTLLARGY